MNRKRLIIGPVDTIVFFGEGRLLLEAARESMRRKINTFVFAAPRHLNGYLDRQRKVTFKKALKLNKIRFFAENDINKSKLLKGILTDKAMGLGLGETYTFNRKTIGLFKGRLFDFMIIDLPRFRGGAHFTWQILQGHKQGCWNIQVINEEMVPGVFDSGEIIKTRKYELPRNCKKPEDYFEVSFRTGLRLFRQFIKEVLSGKEFELTKLNESDSSYFPRLYTPRNAFINWAWDLDEIRRFVCAFDDPYIGAATFLGKRKVFLKGCFTQTRDGRFHPFMAGIIYRIRNDYVYVATRGGSLVISKIYDQNGKNIVKELKLGERFYTPLKHLEDAMCFRPEYSPTGIGNNYKKR